MIPNSIWKNPKMTAIFILKLLIKANSFFDYLDPYMMPNRIDPKGLHTILLRRIFQSITTVIEKKREPSKIIITNLYTDIKPL